MGRARREGGVRVRVRVRVRARARGLWAGLDGRAA